MREIEAAKSSISDLKTGKKATTLVKEVPVYLGQRQSRSCVTFYKQTDVLILDEAVLRGSNRISRYDSIESFDEELTVYHCPQDYNFKELFRL